MIPSDVDWAREGALDGSAADHLTPIGARSVTSVELMRGQRVLVIRHGNDAYRLQITQGGKLILTK